jgi:CheY-like chemotaxis protein
MTSLPPIALVDPDPKGLATLTYAFERDGYTVAGTSDAAMALPIVRATDAKLTVVSLRQPEADLLELIQAMRAHPDTRQLPVVAIGPVESRIAALKAGAFDYLDTPAFVRDVMVVARLVLLTRPSGDDDGATLEVVGELPDFHGLYFLIRAMTATGRSGVLQLSRGHRKGEVKFSAGGITSAQVRSLQAFPALHQLLLWNDGALSLRLREVPPRGQFSMGGPEIVEECERFLRDFVHALEQLGGPTLTSVCGYDPARRAGGAGVIPAEVAPVAHLFDGQRTLGDVIEDSPFRIFDTLRVVKQLIELGSLAPARARVETLASGQLGGVGAAPGGRAAPAVGVPTLGAPASQVRVRTKTASQGFVRTAPLAGVDDLADRRAGGGVGVDRRKIENKIDNKVENKIGKRTPLALNSGRAAAAPRPIQLTAKKTTSPGVTAATAGLDPRKPLRAGRTPVPSRGAVAGATFPPVSPEGPTLQVKLEPKVQVKAEPVAPPPAAVDGAPPQLVARLSLDMAVPIGLVPEAPSPPAARPTDGTVRPRRAERTSERTSDRISDRRNGAGATPTPAFDDLETDFFAREADLYKKETVETFEDLDRGTDPKLQPAQLVAQPGAARKKKR